MADAAVTAERNYATEHRIRIPSVWWCGLTIAFIKLLLTTRGFAGTIKWISQHVGSIPQDEAADMELVKSVEQALAMAGALYPGRALCLEQSLALYYLLQRHGVAVRYCQGVQPHPFRAHSWVEYRGEPINDVAEHAKLFTRLPDQLP